MINQDISTKAIALSAVLLMFSCNSGKRELKNDRKTSDTIKPITADDKYYTRPFVKDTTNVLDGVEQELNIQYTTWGCACANWITNDDRKKYGNDRKYHFFLEPVNDSLEKIEHDIDAFENDILVKGQFYVKKDFPENVGQHEEPMQKAKVFRYYDIRVLKKR